MPCTSDYPSARELEREHEYERIRKELDRVTAMLCGVLSLLEGQKKLVDAKALMETLPSSTKAWWKKHKAFDKQRRAKERAAEQRRIAKENALKKLTKAERILLGLEESEGDME